MLTALVVVDVLAPDGHPHVNWPVLAGVATGAVALRFDRPLPVVLLAAVITTAGIRLIS
jgi:branched-subunit amino acid transport protein